MPQHTVSVTLPSIEIKNSDAFVEVWSDNTLLGTLSLFRGSIDYRPNGHERTVSMSWEDFDQLMRNQL